jgi:hypothetical protein
VRLERLQRPVRTGWPVEGSGRRPVVEDEEDSSFEPGADRLREGGGTRPDLEKLPRLEEHVPAGEPREELRTVETGRIDPLESPRGIDSDPSFAERAVFQDAEGTDRESIEQLVGDDETGETGGKVLDGGKESGPGDPGRRDRPTDRRCVDSREPDGELLRPAAGKEAQELSLARADVDDVDRRSQLAGESRCDPDEAAGKRRMPGGPGHEVSGSTDPTRPFVVAPLRVVQRHFLKIVETDRAFAADPAAESLGEGVSAHGRILPASLAAWQS